MVQTYTASLGQVSGDPRALLARDALRVPAALSRPQVNARATLLGADGTNWAEVLADVSRFHGPALRLLIEGQRTNHVPNPRGEGAAGGTPPTGWSLSNGRGLTHSFTPAVMGGVQGVIWSMTGTPTSTGGTELAFETGATTTVGTTSTISVFHAAISGVFPFAALSLRNAAESAGSATTMIPAATLQRTVNVRTLADTTARCRLSFAFADTVTPVAYAFFLGWPQRTQAAFASTPILPPAASPGPSVRSADIVTAPLAALGIGTQGACTLLWSGLLPQAAPAGEHQTLAQIDAGSDANRIVLRNAAGGTSLVGVPVLGGVEGAVAVAGSLTPGQHCRIGLAHDGAGRIAVSLNGAAAVAVSGAPASGLTTLRIGGGATGTEALFGEVAAFRTYPFALGDAGLAAAVAALPG